MHEEVKLDPFPYDHSRGSILSVYISPGSGRDPVVYADLVLVSKRDGEKMAKGYCGEGHLDHSCDKERAYELVEGALRRAGCPVWLSEAVVETASSGYSDETFTSPSASPQCSEE